VRVNQTTGRFSKKVRFSKKGSYRIRAYRYGVGYSRYKGVHVR
jgi:hypothetical protein